MESDTVRGASPARRPRPLYMQLATRQTIDHPVHAAVRKREEEEEEEEDSGVNLVIQSDLFDNVV